jgi:cytochrome c oxidase subunit 2
MKKYFLLMLIFVIFTSPFLLTSCSVKEGEHNLKLSGKVENGVRIIKMTASRYKFEPDTITVKSGEKIRLLVTSADVSHGLIIPDFKVSLVIDAKKTASVEFIADKKGTFHAHCGVYCGPGHSHMHAHFIVK